MAICSAIVSGYSKSCRDAQGGVKKIFLTELSNKDYIVAVSGVVTSFALDFGKKFWEYEQELNTAFGIETPTPNDVAGTFFVDQAVTITLLKRQASISY